MDHFLFSSRVSRVPIVGMFPLATIDFRGCAGHVKEACKNRRQAGAIALCPRLSSYTLPNKIHWARNTFRNCVSAARHASVSPYALLLRAAFDRPILCGSCCIIPVYLQSTHYGIHIISTGAAQIVKQRTPSISMNRPKIVAEVGHSPTCPNTGQAFIKFHNSTSHRKPLP